MTNGHQDARTVSAGVRWTPAEVLSIHTAALRELEAERLAAIRYQVMQAHRPAPGTGVYRVVDHAGHVVASEHHDPRDARLDADRLVAEEAERLVTEWEAER